MPTASTNGARRLAPAGAARRHFVKESDAVRRKMLAVFRRLPAASYICVSTSRAPTIDQRADLLHDRLLLDQVGSEQRRRDRQTLALTLHRTGIDYSHLEAHSTEPMLWAPDAVAWCAGRQDWRAELESWVTTISVA